MNLQAWVESVKLMGSRQSKTAIRESIKERCLVQKKMVCGTYLIDGEKVWREIILNDIQCCQYVKENRIDSPLDIESLWFSHESILGYRTGRGMYRRFHSKR